MNTKNIITKNSITELLVILKDYFYKKDEIFAAYLFGSFAAGKATPSSDLDIALLIPSTENRMESFRIRQRYHREISDLIDKNVDIVLLREAGEMLSYQILKFGDLIFERDHDSHRAFVAKRVIQCLDFQYYERIMQQGMINAIMVNRSLVLKKIAHVRHGLSRVREKCRISLKALENDLDTQDIILHNLQLTIQGCIDIGAHIIADEGWGVAGSINETILYA